VVVSVDNDVKKVQELVANPSAIGLFGLAVVTLVASSQKLGITGGDAHSVAFVIPWAFFLGALAQFVAGVYDFKHNNVFGGTAFLGYGFFWFGVSMSWMMKLGVFGQAAAAAADPRQLGVAFLAYLIFTLYMTVGAMSTNKVLFWIFVFIDLLFIGLFVSTFFGIEPFWHSLAAYSELMIAILSFYGSAANLLNGHTGQVVLPVGKPFGPWAK
jgi:succinate-acetate transporter protein